MFEKFPIVAVRAGKMRMIIVETFIAYPKNVQAGNNALRIWRSHRVATMIKLILNCLHAWKVSIQVILQLPEDFLVLQAKLPIAKHIYKPIPQNLIVFMITSVKCVLLAENVQMNSREET